jgi:hypothetical protein
MTVAVHQEIFDPVPLIFAKSIAVHASAPKLPTRVRGHCT